MTLPNNKVYATHAAAVASSTFASDKTPYTPLEFTDYAVGAGSDTSSFTVPASSPYTWRVPVPVSKDGFAVTVGGVARTLVETTPSSGQVQLDRVSGKLTFHSSDAAGAAVVTMTPLYTVVSNNEWAMIQSQIVACQTLAATEVVGPASATDNAIARFDGTTGKLIQNTSQVTITDAGVITSTVSTGTAPLVVASTTAVANLNASLLLGSTWAAPGTIGSGTPSTGAFTTISATGVITSTLSTGTAPFTVASTTAVANLNASLLLGSTWAAPAAIGTGTPAAGTFTAVAGTTATFSDAATVTKTISADTAASACTFTLSKSSVNVDTGQNDYGANIAATDSGTFGVAGDTDTLHGIRSAASHTGATSGSAANKTVYGIYATGSCTGAVSSGTSTRTVYGGRFTATGSTDGTSTAYGIYASASGADTNYAAYFSGAVAGDSTFTATQFTSTISTGTAPFVVSSTTNVANLNASSLNGATMASPGAIGGSTPAAGTFTTLTGSTSVTGGTGSFTTLAASSDLTIGTTTNGTAKILSNGTASYAISHMAGGAGHYSEFEFLCADGNTGAGALAGSGVGLVLWGKGATFTGTPPTNYENSQIYMIGGNLVIGTYAGGTGTARDINMNPGGGNVIVAGNIKASTAGNGIYVKEGTNATMGVATLVAGSATVSTTKVTATSRIFLTGNSDGGTPGWVRVSARSAGTSFTITSSSGADTGTVAWIIMEPA